MGIESWRFPLEKNKQISIKFPPLECSFQLFYLNFNNLVIIELKKKNFLEGFWKKNCNSSAEAKV